MNKLIGRSGKLYNLQDNIEEEIWINHRWKKGKFKKDIELQMQRCIINPVSGNEKGNFAFDDWCINKFTPYFYYPEIGEDYKEGVNHGLAYLAKTRIASGYSYYYVLDEDRSIESKSDFWTLPENKNPDYISGFISGIQRINPLITEDFELLDWLADYYLFNIYIPINIEFSIDQTATVFFDLPSTFYISKMQEIAYGYKFTEEL